MELICESNDLNNYLSELNEVDFFNSVIQEKTSELFNPSQTEVEKAKIAFEFVRDEIPHSWDVQGTKVTCKASEVLFNGEGICYAKSNVLAALLRSEGIPTGFCYQRLMLFDTPKKGFCIHALNAIFLKTLNKWIRLDTRGNKQGIDARFSIDEEKLAFTVQEEFDEKDYPVIYVRPYPKTISTLEKIQTHLRCINTTYRSIYRCSFIVVLQPIALFVLHSVRKELVNGITVHSIYE